MQFRAHSRPMICDSPLMLEIKDYLFQVARTDSIVLITGETGTGKDLAAQQIHWHSSRCNGPFVFVNCAALPEGLLESELFGYERGAFTGAVTSRAGKFELAQGGTIFLDEIGDMAPYTQGKLLRAIEMKELYRLGGRDSIPLDVRFIAATNQDLEDLLKRGVFRQDLYFRINVARIDLPPLRERKEDILSLLEHYIGEMSQKFGVEVEGFTDEALEILLYHDWPGNIRELKNLLEATFIGLSCSTIAVENLPKSFITRIEEADGLSRNERDLIISTLFTTKWNKSKAAEKLHWSRPTLYRKMAKYHIVKGGENVRACLSTQDAT